MCLTLSPFLNAEMDFRGDKCGNDLPFVKNRRGSRVCEQEVITPLLIRIIIFRY